MHARQLTLAGLILAGAAVVVPVFVIVGTVAAFWLMPLLLPVGLFVHARFRRRMIEVASLTPCTTCGQALGTAAVKLAEQWSRRASREERYSRIRDVHAICPHCGAWYVFDFDRSRLVPTSRPLGVHA